MHCADVMYWLCACSVRQ